MSEMGHRMKRAEVVADLLRKMAERVVYKRYDGPPYVYSTEVRRRPDPLPHVHVYLFPEPRANDVSEETT